MTAPIDFNADLRALYDAIMVKARNASVNSISHKGRSVGYGDTSLADMIKIYRMMWTPTIGTATGLPLIPIDLAASSATRGVLTIRLR